MFQLCRIRHDLLRLPIKISVQTMCNTALHPGQDGQEAAALIRLAVQAAIHVSLGAGDQISKCGACEWHASTICAG